MNDTLTTKLTELTEMGLKALDFADKTASEILKFVQTNAPDVLQEWITWNIWENIIWLVLWSVLSIFITKLILNDKAKDWEILNDSEGIILLIWGNIAWIMPATIIMLFDTAKIIVAPKLWILENIKNLF